MTEVELSATAYLTRGRRFKGLTDDAVSEVFLGGVEGSCDDPRSAELALDIADSLAELDLRGVPVPWEEARPAMQEFAERHAPSPEQTAPAIRRHKIEMLPRQLGRLQ